MATGFELELMDDVDDVFADVEAVARTFTVETETYDPGTGETTVTSSTDYEVDATPPYPSKVYFQDGEVSRLADCMIYVRGRDLPFVPYLGMKVKIRLEEASTDEMFRCVSLEPSRAGEMVLLWGVHLAR